jgi:hypothetical protein
MTKHVLRHKETGRYLGPKSKIRWRKHKASLNEITVTDLDKARVFSTLSAAHNCDFIAKDVDTSVFYKNRTHTGPNFEYEAVPVVLVLK